MRLRRTAVATLLAFVVACSGPPRIQTGAAGEPQYSSIEPVVFMLPEIVVWCSAVSDEQLAQCDFGGIADDLVAVGISTISGNQKFRMKVPVDYLLQGVDDLVIVKAANALAAYLNHMSAEELVDLISTAGKAKGKEVR